MVRKAKEPGPGAGLLSLSSVTNGVAKVLGGALGDRVGWKKALFMVYALSAVMMLWLMGAESLWMLYVFAVLYGFAFGGNLPLIIGSLGSFFGTRSLAALIGIMAGVGAAFGTLGPIVGGFIFDKLGSYSLAFLLAAIAWGLAALTLLVSKPPVKQTSLPR